MFIMCFETHADIITIAFLEIKYTKQGLKKQMQIYQYLAIHLQRHNKEGSIIWTNPLPLLYPKVLLFIFVLIWLCDIKLDKIWRFSSNLFKVGVFSLNFYLQQWTNIASTKTHKGFFDTEKANVMCFEEKTKV